MRTLDVHLEGVGLVGKLTSDDLMSLSFRYDDAYRGPPLSIALPITIQSYGDVDSRTFFHGLLQEGWQLDDVAAKNRIDRADTVGLLTLLGQECAGAVSVVQEGDPPGKDPGDLTTDYVEIPPEQFALDIANLHARRSPRRRTRFSLAGVQSKMAVVATEDGRFLEPTQGAPSTHIVKVGNANDEVLVENEFVVMKTAFALRLPVVSCNIGRAGDIPYLVVPRFDREIEGNLVRRIHQEDVCQALGLPTSMKYEFAGDVLNPDRMASLANLFKIGRKSADPLTFFQDVLKVTFFNFLVGNADAHAKNFALLHTAAKPRLAPFYDLVCISMYPDISQDLAMTIGQQTDWQRVEAEHWTALLQSAGVKPRIMNTLFKPLAEKIIPAMRSVIENNGLSGSRVSLVLDCVGERIGHLNRTLGWAITVDTDAFVVSGGGWALD